MAATTGSSTSSAPVGLGSEAVKAALAAGKTTSMDRSNGRTTALYALCPTDGQPARVRRVARGERGAVTEVTMRCSRCAGEFVPAVDALYLR
jgi:hypothetical protein